MTLHARRGAPLTDGEIDVLALLADGSTLHEIAAELGIGYDAVSSRLFCIRHKLRARNNVQAAVRAWQTGQLALAAPRRAA